MTGLLRWTLDYAKRMGKNGLSILGDMDVFTHKLKYEELVDYIIIAKVWRWYCIERICLYHKNDFDRLSDEQKQKLIEHHRKALKIINSWIATVAKYDCRHHGCYF